MTSVVFALWERCKKTITRTCADKAIIVGAVIALVSAPALALSVYGGYVYLGGGITEVGSHEGAGDEVATNVAVTWAVEINKESKGDRIVLTAVDTIQQRFVFDIPAPEDVPLPRPRPEDLIALQAPPVDLQPALGDDKREECQWEKLKALPDFMRSCLAPPLQLTPPQQ